MTTKVLCNPDLFNIISSYIPKYIYSVEFYDGHLDSIKKYFSNVYDAYLWSFFNFYNYSFDNYRVYAIAKENGVSSEELNEIMLKCINEIVLYINKCRKKRVSETDIKIYIDLNVPQIMKQVCINYT